MNEKQKPYSLERAEEEASEMRREVENRGAKDYKEAAEKISESIMKKALQFGKIESFDKQKFVDNLRKAFTRLDTGRSIEKNSYELFYGLKFTHYIFLKYLENTDTKDIIKDEKIFNHN